MTSSKICIAAILLSVVSALSSCKKDNVTPAKAVINQKVVMDSGGQNDPTPPPPPPPGH